MKFRRELELGTSPLFLNYFLLESTFYCKKYFPTNNIEIKTK